MRFLEHIEQIDSRLEERREEEHRMALFGMEGAFSLGVGLGAIETRANIFGGQDIYQDGSHTATGIPNIFGGMTYN